MRLGLKLCSREVVKLTPPLSKLQMSLTAAMFAGVEVRETLYILWLVYCVGNIAVRQL